MCERERVEREREKVVKREINERGEKGGKKEKVRKRESEREKERERK